MKKLFIVFTLVSILFIRNISLSSVKAGIAHESQMTERDILQSRETNKLIDFLERGKLYINFDDIYGGAFFEKDEIVINISSKNKEEFIRNMKPEDEFRIKSVQYSQKQLDNEIIILKDYMEELSIESIGRSEKDNTLVIVISSNFIENSFRIKEISILNNLIILYEPDKVETFVKYVINGEELYFDSSSPGTCTSGFAAKNSNGDPGVVTAGHCVEDSNSTNGTDIWYGGDHVGDVGNTSTWQFGGSTDAAFIKLRDLWYWTTWLPTKTFMNGDTYISASAVSSYMVQGTNVYMYGDVSGKVSGEITLTNQTVNMSGTILNNTVVTDIVGNHGDSGAALTYWMYAGSATSHRMVMGVLSGGNTSTTIYTTVDHIFSDLDLTNY